MGHFEISMWIRVHHNYQKKKFSILKTKLLFVLSSKENNLQITSSLHTSY